MAAGKRGPARKPALMVVREGNPGRRPPLPEIVAPPRVPDEPNWTAIYPESKRASSDPGRARYLRRECRRRFRYYVSVLGPMGLLRASDPDTFILMVRLWSELDWERRQLSLEGSLVPGNRNQGWVRNHRWASIGQMTADLKPMIGLFGLAPGARLTGEGPTGNDGWD